MDSYTGSGLKPEDRVGDQDQGAESTAHRMNPLTSAEPDVRSELVASTVFHTMAAGIKTRKAERETSVVRQAGLDAFFSSLGGEGAASTAKTGNTNTTSGRRVFRHPGTLRTLVAELEAYARA